MFSHMPLLILLFSLSAGTWLPVNGQAISVTSAGNDLAALLDSLNVGSKWQKGIHIAWFSGEPNNPVAKFETATHCSAFAAAVAERLGVPILHPPVHAQNLLASPQHRWLENEGQQFGWRMATDFVDLQTSANQGKLALISKESLVVSSPGHIAVVRPNTVYNLTFLQQNGPQVAQSGSTNSPNITASISFKPLVAPNVIYLVFDPHRTMASLPYTTWMTPQSKRQALAGSRTVYAVDAAPGGRVDVIRIAYSNLGNPVWAYAPNGFGLSNNSAWAPWYSYSLPKINTKSEPFITTRNGYVQLGLNGNQLSITDNGAITGASPDTTTTPVSGITGLWYAALDSQFFGIFITKSTSSNLTGYVLRYSPSSGGGSLWETLSATWSGAAGKIAVGTTQKCTLNGISGAPVCVTTAQGIQLQLNGVVGTVTGLSGLVGSATIQKATVMKPVLT